MVKVPVYNPDGTFADVIEVDETAFGTRIHKVALKQATIEGKGLKAKATGSFDGSGKIAKVVLNVESGVLDIDRYLPPPQDKKEPTAEAPKEQKKPADMLAALPDEPLDLSSSH